MFALPSLWCLLLAVASNGQDSKAAGEVALARKAIQRLVDRESVAFDGSVSIETAAVTGGAMIITVGAGVGETPPFEGKFEASSDRDEACVVSEPGTTGFGIYANGDRQLVRATYEESPPNLVTFRGDLLALMDRAQLGKRLAKAEWKLVAKEGDETVVRAAVDTRIVPTAAAANPVMPTARVLRAEMRLRIDKSGEVVRIELDVTRKDPMADLAKRYRADGMGGMGGELPDEPKGAKDEGGPMTRYVLEPKTAGPSKTLQEFRGLMRALTSAPSSPSGR